MAWYNPSDPRQRNIGLVGVLLLLLLYPFYSYWYTPKREEVSAMQVRLENLEDQIHVLLKQRPGLLHGKIVRHSAEVAYVVG